MLPVHTVLNLIFSKRKDEGSLGTIHILHHHIFGIFWTPLPPTSADVIYEWSPVQLPIELHVLISYQLLLELEANLLDQNEFEQSRM